MGAPWRLVWSNFVSCLKIYFKLGSRVCIYKKTHQCMHRRFQIFNQAQLKLTHEAFLKIKNGWLIRFFYVSPAHFWTHVQAQLGVANSPSPFREPQNKQWKSSLLLFFPLLLTKLISMDLYWKAMKFTVWILWPAVCCYQSLDQYTMKINEVLNDCLCLKKRGGGHIL